MPFLQVGVDLLDDRVSAVGLVGGDGVQLAGGEEGVEAPQLEQRRLMGLAGRLIRVIAGDVAGFRGPGVTYTRSRWCTRPSAPGARVQMPWEPEFNALVYVLAGRGMVGAGGLLLLGGRPIREPIAWAGPFLINTESEVHQAFEDFQSGRHGQAPAVHNAPTDLLVAETDSPLDRR
jgi:redox-sensitive bicupin YhaK (pirin superfamily)